MNRVVLWGQLRSAGHSAEMSLNVVCAHLIRPRSARRWRVGWRVSLLKTIESAAVQQWEGQAGRPKVVSPCLCIMRNRSRGPFSHGRLRCGPPSPPGTLPFQAAS
jgi:hypothetical protein